MLETERLSSKMLRRDKHALRHLATVEGEAVSVVVRRLIRKAAREAGLLSTHSRQQAETDRWEVRDAH